jgi:hypothetical protein
MIPIGPMFRLVAVIMEMNTKAYTTVTFSSFDALGIGAILAIICGGTPAQPRVRRFGLCLTSRINRSFGLQIR